MYSFEISCVICSSFTLKMAELKMVPPLRAFHLNIMLDNAIYFLSFMTY